jgi:hypothetical protein
MIWAKKRFEVLKRDNFRCKYCWKNWEDVSLEVDHIIPQSKWWTDNINNLCCCCRKCNMWKWGNKLKESEELYKIKIQDNISKALKFFYDRWNYNNMWNVDKNTYILLNMYVELFIWKKTYIELMNKRDHKKFKKWWDFCEEVLFSRYNYLKLNKTNKLIKQCLDEEQRNNSRWRDIFNKRLNYSLTYWLNRFSETKYAIKKFTLFPNLISYED